MLKKFILLTTIMSSTSFAQTYQQPVYINPAVQNPMQAPVMNSEMVGRPIVYATPSYRITTNKSTGVQNVQVQYVVTPKAEVKELESTPKPKLTDEEKHNRAFREQLILSIKEDIMKENLAKYKNSGDNNANPDSGLGSTAQNYKLK